MRLEYQEKKTRNDTVQKINSISPSRFDEAYNLNKIAQIKIKQYFPSHIYITILDFEFRILHCIIKFHNYIFI